MCHVALRNILAGTQGTKHVGWASKSAINIAKGMFIKYSEGGGEEDIEGGSQIFILWKGGVPKKSGLPEGGAPKFPEPLEGLKSVEASVGLDPHSLVFRLLFQMTITLVII